MDKLDDREDQFHERHLKKVLSNNSSIATAYLQIQEGSLYTWKFTSRKARAITEKN